MPPIFEQLVHKALSSDIRKQIILSLEKNEKYLSEIAEEIGKKPQTIDFHLTVLYEIGLVDSEWKEGKKYYFLKERKILDFLKHGKPLPPGAHPKPPHEIVADAMAEVMKRLDRIEKKLDKLEKK